MNRPRPLSRARFQGLLALLLAALLALLLPGLSLGTLSRAEVYFMDAARAMVESGDWVVPRYEGQPFFDKPILSYWLMAASMTVLGPTPGAARLVPVLASVALLAATAWLGTLLYDRRSALVGALVLATTIAFLSFARVAMSDMLLVALTTTAAGLGWLAYRRPAPRWAVPLLGVALGLAFATKGPIALLAAGIALLLLLARERRLPAGPAGLLLAAAAAAGLGLGWFVLVYARLGTEPLAYFFLRENLSRFAGATYDTGRPPWFFLLVYLTEGLPWAVFLPLAAWRLLQSADERARARWLLLWPALLVIPLSLSRGKLDYYLLPAYPALSLLLGRYFAGVVPGRIDRAWARVTLLLFAGACLGLLFLRPLRLPPSWLPPFTAMQFAVAAALAAMMLIAAVLAPSPRRTVTALAGTVAAGYALTALVFVPAFARALPNRAIAEDVERERRYVPSAVFVYCADPSHVRRDVLFHARHVGRAECDLWSLAASREPFLFLLTPAQDASLRALPGYRHVGSYPVVSARVLTLEGLLGGARSEEMTLAANFATDDPVADRKQRKEYRRSLGRGPEERARLAREAAARLLVAPPASTRPAAR